jgi:SagB-type dehydrogenase family enzyme
MFRDKYPVAWIYHQNTCRTELNTLLPQQGLNAQDTYKEYLQSPNVILPGVELPTVSFSDLLYKRYSCRNFKETKLGLQHLANLLFAGYGLTGITMIENNELLERTVPSGGGLYPLEFYILVRHVEDLAPGVYHYVIRPPLLELVTDIELPKPFLQNLFMQQPYVADAPVTIVATTVLERSMKKYADRGYRYILYEAGHAFQNINLMAAACNLGSLNIGGFYDVDMSKLLGIDMEKEIPLYAMAVGVPGSDGKDSRVPIMI